MAALSENVELEALLKPVVAFFEALAASKVRHPYKEHICDYSPGTGIVCLESTEVPRGETRWVSSIAAIAYGCTADYVDITAEYMSNVFGRKRTKTPAADNTIVMLGSMVLTEGMYVKVCWNNVSACTKVCLVLNGGQVEGHDPVFLIAPALQGNPAEGDLFVDSNPQGANVYASPALRGVTPLFITDLDEGSREVRATLLDYLPWDFTAHIVAGELKEYSKDLWYCAFDQAWAKEVGINYAIPPSADKETFLYAALRGVSEAQPKLLYIALSATVSVNGVG